MFALCLSQSFPGWNFNTHKDKIWPLLEVTLSTCIVCTSLKCLFKSGLYICAGAWDQNQDWMHVNYVLFMFFLSVLSRGWMWRFHMGCNSRETFVRPHLNPTHLLKHESTHTHAGLTEQTAVFLMIDMVHYH